MYALTAHDCLNMQYMLLKGMFFDDKKETGDYILCTSKVMDDYFWNIAYFKKQIGKSTLLNLENEFKAIHRVPSIYIGRDDPCYNENKKLLLANGYNK